MNSSAAVKSGAQEAEVGKQEVGPSSKSKRSMNLVQLSADAGVSAVARKDWSYCCGLDSKHAASVE